MIKTQLFNHLHYKWLKEGLQVMREILDALIGTAVFSVALFALCGIGAYCARKEKSDTYNPLERPDLIWNSYPKEKKTKIEATVLIGSWSIALVLFGVVMLYG